MSTETQLFRSTTLSSERLAGHRCPTPESPLHYFPIGRPFQWRFFADQLQFLRTAHEFKLSAFRGALDHRAHKLGVTDLIASKNLYAHPGELFPRRYGQLINLNSSGQHGIKAVPHGLLHRIQWYKGLAVRFFAP
jgi:hypothetical protein